MNEFECKLDEGKWDRIKWGIISDFHSMVNACAADSPRARKRVRNRGDVFLRYGLGLMGKPATGVIFRLKFEVYKEKFLEFLKTRKSEHIDEYKIAKRSQSAFLGSPKDTEVAVGQICRIVEKHYPEISKLEGPFLEKFEEGMKRLGVSTEGDRVMWTLRSLSGTPFFNIEKKGFLPPVGRLGLEQSFLNNDVEIKLVEISPTLPEEIKYHEKTRPYYDHGDVSIYKIQSPCFIYYAESKKTVFVSAIERNKIIDGVSPDFKKAFSKDEIADMEKVEGYLQKKTDVDEWVLKKLRKMEGDRIHEHPRDLIDEKLLEDGYITRRLKQALNGKRDRDAGMDITRFFFIDFIAGQYTWTHLMVRDGGKVVPDNTFLAEVEKYGPLLIKAQGLLSKTECMKGYSLSLFLPLFSLMVPKKKLVIPTPEVYSDSLSMTLVNAENIMRDLEEYELMGKLYNGKSIRRALYVEVTTCYFFHFRVADFSQKFQKLKKRDYDKAFKDIMQYYRLREEDILEMVKRKDELTEAARIVQMWKLKARLFPMHKHVIDWDLK